MHKKKDTNDNQNSHWWFLIEDINLMQVTECECIRNKSSDIKSLPDKNIIFFQLPNELEVQKDSL